MVDQARMLVFRAVANATKTPIPQQSPVAARPDAATGTSSGGAHSQEEQTSPSGPPAGGAAPKSLAGFRSALNLSSNAAPLGGLAGHSPGTGDDNDQSPRLQKARSSALRLSNVLYGRGTRTKEKTPSATLGNRRMRSVQWDNPSQVPKINVATGGSGGETPSAKKARMAANAAKLKSFKSFGRPHAGDFGSGPRNATFGEFSRAHLWGRDGRLAHHPSPMQQSMATSDQIGLTGVADKNATFDLKFSQHRRSATSPSNGTSLFASSMPRTTTNLEQYLIKSSTSGNKL